MRTRSKFKKMRRGMRRSLGGFSKRIRRQAMRKFRKRYR